MGKDKDTRESYENGYSDGRKWERDNGDRSIIETLCDPLGFLIPNPPQKSGDKAYNEGAKQGMNDEKKRR